MSVPKMAAPPTPWSRDLAKPSVDKSAYVHSFSNLIGDVTVGANVLIAPGTSIRADEGTPFYIGDGSNIQDGVVIHGLEQGRVLGENRQEYSVWIGKQTCITHLALIHGPAYVGNNCFIGFRSTIFNARVGDGCIVMMHTLIQDVEIPPGKYVPSGAIITNQQQADRLPDVQPEDREFASHVVHINEALAKGYNSAENQACINPIQEQNRQQINRSTNSDSPVTTMSLSPDIINQVRSLLRQGCQIGAEHANARRFKTKSWLTTTIKGTNENQILGELDSLLQQYQGEYVRLIGVDPNVRRRVVEMIIQRPDDRPGHPDHVTTTKTSPHHTVNSSRVNGNNGNSFSSSGNGDITSEISSLIRAGYQIGVEHADSRRFKTKSWLTAPAITTTSVNQAVNALQSYLADFSGEYVRVVGVDPQARRRVAEIIVQRPDGDSPVTSNGSSSVSSYQSTSSHSSRTSNVSGGLSSDAIQQIRTLLAQGYQIGSEHADKRRFKTKSWQSCAPIDSRNERDVISALETCLQEHSGEYVRLIGIDTNGRRRVLEMIIQRPEQNSQPSTVTNHSSNNGNGSSYSSTPSYSNSTFSGNSSNSLNAEVVNQIRSLLTQGHQIGTEHADKRRFKTKSWQSCAPIDSRNERDIISALEGCLKEHNGEYVRLIGIDKQAKRRVLEAIIQRP